MTEFVTPLCGMDETFKLFVEYLIPKIKFPPWKKKVSIGYDVIQSDKCLILLETNV